MAHPLTTINAPEPFTRTSGNDACQLRSGGGKGGDRVGQALIGIASVVGYLVLGFIAARIARITGWSDGVFDEDDALMSVAFILIWWVFALAWLLYAIGLGIHELVMMPTRKEKRRQRELEQERERQRVRQQARRLGLPDVPED